MPPTPPPLYCPSLFPSPLVTSRLFSISVSLHFCYIVYFVVFSDSISDIIQYLSISELFYLIVYLPCYWKCQYSILYTGQLLSMPFKQMALPPHTWHGSPAKFPSLHARRETPSPLPLLPWEVYLWSWVWSQFFPPPPNTFWQTGPSGPISNSTGPISLPLYTFIPVLPALPPTLRELGDKHNLTSGWFYFHS